MSADRFVLLGLAGARAEWFRRVARWSTSGTLPVEFVKCLTPEEVRARLGSGRRFSAVLLDEALGAVDRDLIAAVHDAGCAAVVVVGDPARRPWRDLGADETVPGTVEPDTLRDVLRGCCLPVDHPVAERPGTGEVLEDPVGRLVTVCGSGGVGASTVAVAVSQGLGRLGATPVLVDLARNGEQAVLHGAEDPSGLQSLVERYRRGDDDPREIAARLWAVSERGYHLLPGLRRPGAWSSLRPAAFRSTLSGLLRHCGTLVCDTDGDLEGERDGGSVDVEERNLMSRTAVEWADVVVAVGSPGLKGMHSLVRLLNDVTGLGTEPDRIVVVVNRSPRHRHAREVSGVLKSLAAPGAVRGPVFVPERPQVERCLRYGTRLPAAVVDPLMADVLPALETLPRRGPQSDPVRVEPGSLGHWRDDAEAVP